MQTTEECEKNSQHVVPTPEVDSAVGMPRRQWFVAIVKRNTEKSCRDKLLQMGYEAYVATQEDIRQWRNGTKKKIERVVITTIVFIRTTEKERRVIVNLPFINRFMTNKSAPKTSYGNNPIATIPDSQMRLLQFMLYNADSEVSFSNNPLRANDRIKVVRGSLKGFEGNVVRTNGTTFIVVNLDILGCAMIHVSPSDIKRI